MNHLSEPLLEAAFLSWMNEIGVKQYWYANQKQAHSPTKESKPSSLSILDLFQPDSPLRSLDENILIAYQQYIDNSISWSDADEKWLRTLQRPVQFKSRYLPKLVNPHRINYYEYLIWAKRDDLKQKFPFPFTHPHHDLFSKWLLQEGPQSEKLPPFIRHKPISPFGYSLIRILRHLGRGAENKWSHDIGFSLQSLRICVHGYLMAEMGLGEAARAYVRALKLLNIDLSLINVSLFNPGKQQNLNLLTELDPVIPQQAHVHIFIMNPPEFKKYWDLIKNHASFRRPHLKVGQIAWELPQLPNTWTEIMEEFDQVWVFSDFVAQAVNKSYNKPVFVIPLSTETSNLAQRDNSLNFQTEGVHWTQTEIIVPHVETPTPFRFITLVDGFSTLERKNPMAVIKAFAQAFADNSNALLVVKMTNAQVLSQEWNLLQKLAEQVPHVFLISETLDHAKNLKLIQSAHCLVSAHRAEGYGLTLQEAMSAGVPVMGTGWSGNLQFMNHTNSELLPYHLVTLEKDYGPYPKGQQWAEVSTDVLAEHMKDMVQRYHFFKSRAEQVKFQIQEKFCPQEIAKQIDEIFRQETGIR